MKTGKNESLVMDHRWYSKQIICVNIWRKDNKMNNPSLVCPAPRRRVSVMVWGSVSYHDIGTLSCGRNNKCPEI